MERELTNDFDSCKVALGLLDVIHERYMSQIEKYCNTHHPFMELSDAQFLPIPDAYNYVWDDNAILTKFVQDLIVVTVNHDM